MAGKEGIGIKNKKMTEAGSLATQLRLGKNDKMDIELVKAELNDVERGMISEELEENVCRYSN